MTGEIEFPALDFTPPACGLCGDQTDPSSDHEGFVCHSCQIYWPWSATATTSGEALDPEVPRCGVEHSPWPGDATLGPFRYRCLQPVHDDGPFNLHTGVRVAPVVCLSDTHTWRASESWRASE